ncbi:class I SAM-dependent DNA methyltransferase [Oryzibacter oryziterrae]|uniref:class I SAM-dependent DNA methyltransferase n=1 Tax=Oryzibacter oryziterrae TaxID=2766474 RepID=UPI001F442C98|nr:class I SAM-dependent methyltransferase [Oryzibacter oryziterrae]
MGESDIGKSSKAYWAQCSDTHVANAVYYRRVTSLLPVICDLYLNKDANVVDVGCGNGELSSLIAAHCRSLRGTDISEQLVAQANARKIANAEFSAEAVELLFRHGDGAYDTSFAMGLFATLHGDVFEETVAELARITKPGGFVVTRDSLTNGSDIVRHVVDGYHAHYRNRDRYLSSFRAHGLPLVREVFLDAFTDINNSLFVFRRE